ncbi:MAG: hypothetical protein WC985_03270, partial [Thermoplasmata archaeon]
CLGPQIERELAVCYLSPPTTTRDGAAPKLTEPRGPVAQALLWSLMPDFQGRVLWSREYVMRLEVTTNGDLLYRPVPPWLVDGDADPAHPDQFIRYLEWVPRSIPFLGGVADATGTPEDVWTRDEINLTDKENPFLRVWDESGTVDLTEFVFGPAPDEGSRSQEGRNYPFRWRPDGAKLGAPWMPVELYHRDPDAQLWHYTQGRELVSATRMAAVLWSLWVHNYRDASYSQRVIWDGKARAGTTPGSVGAAYISPDSTLVLSLESTEGKQGRCDGWPMPSDPEKLMAGLQGYMAQACTREGVSPAELQRLSGDKQSGVAIALTNAGKRLAQRRFGPQFKIRDESLLCKSAALWNRAHPDATQYPEDGYQVSYTSIPLSPDEEKAIREQCDWELSKGWITLAQALARVAGIPEDEAKKILDATRAARLEEARKEAALQTIILAMQPKPPPPPPVAPAPTAEPTPGATPTQEPAHV